MFLILKMRDPKDSFPAPLSIKVKTINCPHCNSEIADPEAVSSLGGENKCPDCKLPPYPIMVRCPHCGSEGRFDSLHNDPICKKCNKDILKEYPTVKPLDKLKNKFKKLF